MSGDLSSANVLIEKVKRIINDAQFILNDDAEKILRKFEATAREGFEIGTGALPNVKIEIGKLHNELRSKTKMQKIAKAGLRELISK